MASDEHIKLSLDGSHTVISEIFDVPYHSKHGAIAESNVVFLDAGLNYFKDQGKDYIRIFEMGFGTGLNVFLSFIWSATNNVKLTYHTIEAFPLGIETTSQLNYPEILGEKEVFENLHSCDWDLKHYLSKGFEFCKHLEKLEEFKTDQNFDVIFYDAFAPSSQPELWDIPVLQSMYDILDTGGIIVSYCAQGAFKRNLKAVGFTLENLPGPPGKREMTRGIKA
jgi:tRNA U34 5-methylaminomethyl-2-thiouridine-forming methyltransferase MnmC